MSADAVVIGAGHNGLVAANLLADAGWEVVVLEATGAVGGAVRSAEVTAPGYLSDLCSAFYPLAICSPVLNRLRLHEHGLRWRHAPDVLAHLLPDGRAAVLNLDHTRTAASVEQFAQGDGLRWASAYREWLNLSRPLLHALFTPFPPVAPGLRIVRRARVAGALRLARRLVLPMRQLARELFTGEGAALLMAGCAMHTDLSPDDAASGVYGWLLAMLGQEFGFPVPVGGAQSLTDALAARLISRGGSIVDRAPADRITIKGGRATGVTTTDGRRWKARRAVLADVPAPALFLDLVGPHLLPPRMVEDLEHFRWDGATVKVDWALSAPAPWNNPEVAGAGTVHLGADLNGLTRFSAALACDEVPRAPFLVCGQMTTADPVRSPAGTESFWAYTHLPQRRQWQPEEILRQVERMEAVLEEHAPGFTGQVVGRRFAGPAALHEENPSLVGGALGGGTSAAYQQLFFRPIPGLGRADTPIRGLYLASSSAHPGGGVHGGPGSNAARAALTAHKPITGSVYRATIAAALRTVYR